MKKSIGKVPVWGLLAFFLLAFLPDTASAQTPIVSFKVAKESPDTREFVVVWESPDYKGTLADLEQLFRQDDRVISEQYLWKLHQVSVLTKKEMTAESFLALLKAEGYEVRQKQADHAEDQSGKK